MPGYARVNMSTGNVRKLALPPEMRLSGGRGLIARLLYSEMDPVVDPLGSKNVFILCNGLLAPCGGARAGRLSVGAKSPLSGVLRESGAPGAAGFALAELGLRAVVVEGRSAWPAPRFLVLARDKIQLVDASGCQGLGFDALCAALRREHGADIAVAGTGLAGERGYRCATVQVSDRLGRVSAACGGLGAVMASKGLRAVVLKNGRTPAADRRGFRSALDNCLRLAGAATGPEAASCVVELAAGLSIADRGAAAAIERGCADAGLDVEEVCAMAGLAMQAGLIAVGDASAVADLIGQMAAGTPLGQRMGEGAARFARVVRASAMHGAARAQSEAACRTRAALDCLGLSCAVPPAPDQATLFALLAGMLKGMYGGAWSAGDVLSLGDDALAREQAFNDWAGMPSHFAEPKEARKETRDEAVAAGGPL